MTWLPQNVPAEARATLCAQLKDVKKFARLHKITPKDGPQIKFAKPHPLQIRVWDAIKAGKKAIIVVKSRAVGCTTACKMALQHALYTSEVPAKFAIVGNLARTAESLLLENRRWLLELPEMLQRPTSRLASSTVTLRDTGASLSAYTGRSIDSLRGESRRMILITEAGYFPDLSSVLRACTANLGDDSVLILESTVDNPGTLFAQMVQNPGDYHLITYWWWEHPTNKTKWSEDQPAITEAETDLMGRYGLTLDQIAWRRREISRLGGDEDQFRREHPACIEDLFIRTAGTHLPPAALDPIVRSPLARTLEDKSAQQWEYSKLDEDKPATYAIGVDVSGGVGSDYSVICVVDTDTKQPVHYWRSNLIAPAALVHKIVDVAYRFCTANGEPAKVLVEQNNHGHAVLLGLGQMNFYRLWVDENGKPWATTAKSKLHAYALLRQVLEASMIEELPAEAWLELRALRAKDSLAPEAPPGSHDDMAVATALAVIAAQKRDITPLSPVAAAQARAARRTDATRRRGY